VQPSAFILSVSFHQLQREVDLFNIIPQNELIVLNAVNDLVEEVDEVEIGDW
jgi:hypothetical protein